MSLQQRMGVVVAMVMVSLSLVARGEVVAYPRVPGDVANPEYVSVKVNGVEVPTVMTTMRVGYAHFGMNEKVQVEVTASEPIKSFDLSPHRAGIVAKAEGQVLRFELDKPAKLHLRINGLTRFFVFGDPIETEVPVPGQAGAVSLADFDVTPGESVQTAAIQKAIDETAAKKGTLVVPAGMYRAGRLVLRSGLNLYLAPGAVIKGTGDLADYENATKRTAQFYMEDAQDVRVFGRGVLDANGQMLRRKGENATLSRGKLMMIVRSRNVHMDDVILRESPVWCVHMIESEDLAFRNLKLISATRAEWAESMDEFLGGNTDGFDPDNSSRVLIENNFISVDDDPAVVKLTGGKRRDVSDIQVRNNVMWTMCSALKIGTEILEKTVSNVVFENNDVVHADTGIAIYSWRGGTVENCKWINNHFEAVGRRPSSESPHRKETNIRLTIRNVKEAGFGHVRNILIKDNTFEDFGPNDALIQGGDDEHQIENVTIENLSVKGQQRVKDEDARLTIGRFTRSVVFK